LSGFVFVVPECFLLYNVLTCLHQLFLIHPYYHLKYKLREVAGKKRKRQLKTFSAVSGCGTISLMEPPTIFLTIYQDISCLGELLDIMICEYGTSSSLGLEFILAIGVLRRKPAPLGSAQLR